MYEATGFGSMEYKEDSGERGAPSRWRISVDETAICGAPFNIVNDGPSICNEEFSGVLIS